MAGPVRRRGAVTGSVSGYAKAYPERGADAGVYRFLASVSPPEWTFRPPLTVEQAAQSLQTGVYAVVRVVVRTARKFLPADDAQPGAVFAAEGRDRLRQKNVLPDLLL